MKNAGLLLYLLFTSCSLFAQSAIKQSAINVPTTKFDLTFYTTHYRIHCVTASGVCISHDDVAKAPSVHVKDTVIGLVYKSKSFSNDSIIIKYPFKEKLDSVTLHVVDNENKRMPITSFDLIFMHRLEYKTISPSSNPYDVISCAGKITEQANELFKNEKAGDEIVFKNIKITGPDGSTRNLAPLELTLR